MERKYKRLTREDREYIGKLLMQGFNQVHIAQLLGFHKSTICREIKRNQESRLGYIFGLVNYLVILFPVVLMKVFIY